MSGTLSRRRFLARAGVAAATVSGVTGVALIAAFGTREEAAACMRPPGALPEEEFLSACIRCGRCSDACPNRCIVAFTSDTAREHALVPGRRQLGTPVLFPRRQACMLCNGAHGENLLCTEACPSGALQLTSKAPAAILDGVHMGTAEVDTNICYSFNGASCGVCVRACPFEGSALRAGMWEKPLVDPAVCVGCGLCERSCVHYPQAIRVRPSTSDRPKPSAGSADHDT